MGDASERGDEAWTARSQVPSVLVVDDEQVTRAVLTDFLSQEGYKVWTVDDARSALALMQRERIDLVLSGLCLPEMSGLDLLRELKESHPFTVALIMTAYPSVETATQAMKLGAFDYLQKPFKIQDVMLAVRRGLTQQRLRSENLELRAAISLYQLASRMSTSLELLPNLRLIAETVQEQTRATGVHVILFPRNEIMWDGVNLGDPLTEEDLTEETLALTTAVVVDEAHLPHYIEQNERTKRLLSVVIVPLFQQEEHFGVLIASSTQRNFWERDRKLLTIIADRASAAVQSAQLFEALERSFRHTIEALVTALEEKDPYTAGHSERVALYARLTAERLGLPPHETELIYQAGRLHDIGKLTIRSDELNKPTGLTPDEVRRFRLHPVYGEELLGAIPTFKALLPAIGGHHENYDGTGYPRGLKGKEIPLMARIMAVADSYDAMTSHRAYRKALPHAFAVEELKACSGTQYDPHIVAAFLLAIEDWRKKRIEAGLDVPA